MEFDDFSALEAAEYSGRSFIAFRTTEGNCGFSYGLTGRSPGSQARRLVRDEKSGVMRTELVTKPEELKRMFNVSDEEIPNLLKKIEGGNRALTIYPAMRWVVMGKNPRLIVSNGAQTKLIYSSVRNSDIRVSPGDILRRAFQVPFYEYDEKTGQDIDLTCFEPDNPIYTPRINGCMDNHHFAYQVVRRDPKEFAEVHANELELQSGQGILIATYKGGNEKPIVLPFEKPLEVRVGNTSSEGICRRVYDIITRPNPNDGDKVYGVAVVTMMMKPNFGLEYTIYNRADEVMK